VSPPAEVASVAIAGIAGEGTALTAALLIGSTLVTVVAAGLILAALGATATISPSALLTQLVLVIVLPLAAGITTRATLRPTRSLLSACAALGTLALLVLLWRVAGPDQSRARVRAGDSRAAGLPLPAVPALGWLLTLGLPRHAGSGSPSWSRCATSPSLPASPRPPSAPPPPPLGIYGALVLLAGALAVHAHVRA
jgi:hypothetical protein